MFDTSNALHHTSAFVMSHCFAHMRGWLKNLTFPRIAVAPAEFFSKANALAMGKCHINMINLPVGLELISLIFKAACKFWTHKSPFLANSAQTVRVRQELEIKAAKTLLKE